MIKTETDATVTLEAAVGESGAKYGLLTVANHIGSITVALDATELRTLIGDGVEVWGEVRSHPTK